MKSAHHSHRLVRVAVLVMMFPLLAGPCLAMENLRIESGTDPAYLPFYLDSLISKDLSKVNVRLRHVIEPLTPIEVEAGIAFTLVLAQNPEANSSDRSRFTTYSYNSSWQVGNEYPMPFTILSWGTRYDSTVSSHIVTATGRTREGIQIGQLVIGDSSVDRNSRQLMKRYEDVKPDDWWPSTRIFKIADYDMDGDLEAFLQVNGNPKPRRLFCIDLTTLETEWELDVAGPIISLEVERDTVDARIVMVTSNPMNGARDSDFVDWFQYFAVINNQGEIIRKRIIGSSFKHSVELCASPESGYYYLAHALDYQDSTSIPDSVDSIHHLSLVDSDGNIHKSVMYESIPFQLALVPFGDDGLPHIWVRSRDNSVSIYTLELEEVAYCENTNIGEFLGEISISGEEDSLLVFSDGLYDRDFSKVLQFPFIVSSVVPIAYDVMGHTTDIALNATGRFYLGRVTKKSLVDLATVFYHRNQVYVLMVLSSLLVGLVMTNSFWRRSKKNHDLIALQKSELEQTHAELIETQEALIVAEKYKQARDIAGGFAHEIRNALFPADGFLTKIKRGGYPTTIESDKLREYHIATHSAIARAIGITELISLYTKLDSEYLPEETGLLYVVKDVFSANKLRIEQQKVIVNLPTIKDAYVQANTKQMEIVINNLLLNSLDALKDTGEPVITLDICTKNNQIHMKFIDNGSGIKSDDLERVFDAFFSTKPETGIGIGLSTVKKIVEMYSGKIKVRSVLGHGTEVNLTFPSLETNS